MVGERDTQVRWMDRQKAQNVKRALQEQCRLQGAELVATANIAPQKVGLLRAVTDDPQISLRLQAPAKEIFVRIAVRAQAPEPCWIYYAFADAGEVFEEYFKIDAAAYGAQEGVCLCFQRPVAALRIDPVAREGLFFAELCVDAQNAAARASKRAAVRPDYAHMPLQAAAAECGRLCGGDTERAVLLVTHQMTRTGAPLLCLHLAQTLRLRGWTVFCLAQGGGDLTDAFEQGTDGLFVRESEPEPALFAALAQVGIRRAVCNTALTGKNMAALKAAGFRTVGLVHEMRATIQICCAQESAREMAHAGDVLVFPAQCVAEDFYSVAGRPAGRVEVFHQGLYKQPTELPAHEKCAAALHSRYAIGAKQKIVVCAGSMTFGKGPDLVPLVLERLNALQEALRGKVTAVWLGAREPGPYGVWLQNQIEKMGMAESIIFTGFVDGQAYLETLCGADAFLLPSREDSMPSVLLEAMACGIPCIAFEKSGGAQELLAAGRGVLVPYMDTDAMARALADLLMQEARRTAVCAAARSYVSADARQSAYAEKIEQLLG